MPGHSGAGPKSVGDYDIVAKIAEGGMASVYKGRHRSTGEVVAIKIIKPEQVGERSLKRFELEIQASSNLEHPHIVRGLDFGREGKNYYLVMEFVEGESLGDRIERAGRLAEADAVEIIGQVAQALHHAHQQGLIHRDVKPDNILIGADGQTKLTDLGLIKNKEFDQDLTRPDTGLGTPNFMAPEQFDNAKNADLRCDVYSLGATLYMAVTGVLPFDGKTTLAVLKKKLTNEIDPPRKLVPKLSEAVDLAIRRSLRDDPQQRFASCLEFLAALGSSEPRVSPIAMPAVALVSEAPAKALTPADRRGAPRFPVQLVSSCQPVGGEEEEWAAVVQDISATGMRLLIDRRFEPRTTLLIKLIDSKRWIPTVLVGRVVRVEPGPARKWTVGCVFGGRLSDEEIVALR